MINVEDSCHFHVCAACPFLWLYPSSLLNEGGGSRVSSSAEKLSVDFRTEVLCTITKSRFRCKIQNHRFRVVSCRNFFSSKKIRFFAHCVKSDIIVQDMQNCFKGRKKSNLTSTSFFTRIDSAVKRLEFGF